MEYRELKRAIQNEGAKVINTYRKNTEIIWRCLIIHLRENKR